MKYLFYGIVMILFSQNVLYAQNPNSPKDSTVYSAYINDNNNAVYFRNDTLFVNSSTYFLYQYFNFRPSDDSLQKISDTIITKYADIYKIDTITHTTLRTYKQQVSFNWQKSIPYNSSYFTPPTTAYKSTSGMWDDCTLYPYVYGTSHICFAVQICDLPDNITYNWCSGNKYTKIYEDNFEGTKIDPAHWSMGFPWGTRESGLNSNNTQREDNAIALNRNVEVSNGTLKLKSQVETGNVIDSDGTPYGTHPFSQGAIFSALSFQYGKYSMRAKVPISVGVNPAYWLYNSAIEIDGFEFFNMNRTDAPQMTVYSNKNTNLTGGPCFGYDGKSRIFSQTAHKNVWNNLPDLSLNWYIYTIVYDPSYITFFIESDDHLNAWKITYPNVIQQNQNNVDPNQNCSCTGCVVQVNANFPDYNSGNVSFLIGNSPTRSKDFVTGSNQQLGPYPNTVSVMEIDWVKIYVPDKCSQNITENSGQFQAVNHNNTNHLTGDNVTLGGNGTATTADEYKIVFWGPGSSWENKTPRTSCAARANNEVALLDGFSAEENTLFEGSISFQGGNNVPSDCNNITYWPQLYRTANNQQKNLNDTLASENEISIFPNPSANLFYINYNKKLFIDPQIDIYDALGKIVLHQTLTEAGINTQSLSNGMYYVKFYGIGYQKLSKFIKQN